MKVPPLTLMVVVFAELKMVIPAAAVTEPSTSAFPLMIDIEVLAGAVKVTVPCNPKAAIEFRFVTNGDEKLHTAQDMSPAVVMLPPVGALSLRFPKVFPATL